MNFLSTQKVNVARYARNVEGDFFCNFQSLWLQLFTRVLNSLNVPFQFIFNTSSTWDQARKDNCWSLKLVQKGRGLLEDLGLLKRPQSITSARSQSHLDQQHKSLSWRTIFTASLAMALVITASVRGMLKPNSRNVHFLLLSQSPLLGSLPKQKHKHFKQASNKS